MVEMHVYSCVKHICLFSRTFLPLLRRAAVLGDRLTAYNPTGARVRAEREGSRWSLPGLQAPARA